VGAFSESMWLGTFLAAMLFAAPAHAADKGLVILPTVYRVGASGPPCTHATLAAALAAAPAQGVTIIRLADNQAYTGVNVNFSARNITIEGGYADCAATTSTGNRTVLNGGAAAADSVIEIASGSTAREVELRHLEIRGGTEDADGGGGLQVEGETQLTLVNVRFRNNASTTADPVELHLPPGGATGAVVISDNSASGDGGGIFCDGAQIRVDGTLQVSSNAASDASGGGGGMALSDCALTVGQPGSDPAELLLSNNTASSGGGLRADDGSTLLLRGARTDFINNRARNAGGGFAVSGTGTLLVASSLYMSVNHVSANGGSPAGGAISVGSGAEVTISQDIEPCRTLALPPTRACNTIRNSYVESTFGFGFGALGAAIAVRGSLDTHLTLAQTYLGGNHFVENGDLAEGSALYAENSGMGTTRVELESVIIDGNTGGGAELVLGEGADAELGFTSINVSAEGDPAIRTEAGAVVELHGTASLADTLIDASAGGTVSGSCNFLAPGDDSLASVGVTALSDFVDAGNGDLRPLAGATTLDRCSDEQFAPQYPDALGRERPVDVPELPNSPGPFDAGAYEFVPEPVFSDGFEGP
jgi:predicted outer membrane repeat protein